VVIVDDHALFRSGVRSELGSSVEVVGEADDVAPAIAVIGACVPDVVLIDVHLPGGGGQAVVAALRASHPQVRFLALSASDAPEDVINVIRAGARGYVTKTISGAELVEAVRRVATARRCSRLDWPGSFSTPSQLSALPTSHRHLIQSSTS
jgi:DNA-binding NarL/FixJ family response regulator